MTKMVDKPSISAGLATKMVEAAVLKASELKVAQVVAVVEGGNLKAFCRMDGASPVPIEIAQNKAFTALFGMPTSDFFDFIKGDASLLAGIPQVARVCAIGGGFPVMINGSVVGAIGVSGGSIEADIACAKAGLDAVK
jgi:uncharacterized protein GlcG (DUF336 family)